MGASDNLAVIPADISLLFRCSAAVISLFFDRRFAREMRDFRVLGESVIFYQRKQRNSLVPQAGAMRCRGDLPDGFCRIVRLISTR
jgi:hypothetical protein